MSTPTKLLNKNFFLLWQGQFVSMLGGQAYFIAMMFWIKHETGSATLMGTLMAVSQIPSVLLGPVAGTYADLHSRKAIIVWCDILRGVLVLGLTALVFFAPQETDLIIIALFVAAVLLSTLSAFFRPAVSAAIPDLVPTDKVAAANSMNATSMQASMLLGQGVGGVAFRLLGAPLLFFIDGVTYIFSAVSEMFITIPQKVKSNSQDFGSVFARYKHDTLEGLRYVWRDRGMRNLTLASSLINFFITPIIVLLPFYVEDFLGETTDWFGYLLAAFGAGSILGYVFAGAWSPRPSVRSWTILVTLVLDCALFGAIGLVTDTFWAAGLFALIGLLNGYLNVCISTTFQLRVPSEMRGRVFGLLGTISGGLAPIAMGLAGVIADLTDQNVAGIFIGCGLLAAAISAIMVGNKSLREFLAYELPAKSGTDANEDGQSPEEETPFTAGSNDPTDHQSDSVE